MPWLELLIGLLAFAAGWVGCAVFETVVPERRGPVDFTAAAARGDLVRFDWGDARGASSVNVQATGPAGPIIGQAFSEGVERQRHLRSVD